MCSLVTQGAVALTSVVIPDPQLWGQRRLCWVRSAQHQASAQIQVMVKLNPVTLEHFNVSAAWFLGLFVLLGNFLSMQGNLQFLFPVPRVEHGSEGIVSLRWVGCS